MFAEGKSSREIAELLFVSVKTVGTHKQNILDKLELKSTTDLVKYALKKGIITLAKRRRGAAKRSKKSKDFFIRKTSQVGFCCLVYFHAGGFYL